MRAISDLNLRELMELNICDARNRYDVEINEFYNKVFVEYSENPLNIIDLEKNLHDVIVNEENSKEYIFFLGSGGTGKSTFLNYFFKKYYEINCEQINFIGYTSGIGDDKLVRDNLSEKISKLLNNADKTSYYDFFNFLKSDNNFENLKNCFNDKSASDKILSFVIYNFSISKQNNRNFIDKFDTDDLISLYLVLKIGLEKVFKYSSRFVVLFDNLDSFEQNYIAKNLIIKFSDIHTYLKKLFNNHICFIFCFREMNYYSINWGIETPSRFEAKAIVIDFKNSDFFQKIINKRLALFKELHNDQTNSYKFQLYELLTSETLKNDLNKTFMSIFNYNIRSIINCINCLTNSSDTSYINITAKQYSEIKEYSIDGIRGILLFYIMKYLKKEKVFNNNILAEDLQNKENEIAYCNQNRMLMTILHNLFYFKGRDQINLDQLIEKLLENKDVFTLDQVINFLNSFFTPTNAHSLIIIGHEILNDRNIINHEEQVFDLIFDILEKIYDKFPNPSYHNYVDKLKVVHLKINTVLSICVETIFIHYEYFNFCLSFINHKETKPLFLSLTIDNDNIYDFEKQIKAVYNFIFETIVKMDNYFCENFCKSKCNNAINNIISSNSSSCQKVIDEFNKGLCSINDSIYSTRIISSQINYLEKFRKFLFTNKNAKKEILKNDLRVSAKNPIEIQLFLIEYIEKFIKLFLDKKVKDSKNAKLFSTLNSKVEKAKQFSKENLYFDIEFNPGPNSF